MSPGLALSSPVMKANMRASGVCAIGAANFVRSRSTASASSLIT